MVTMSHMMAPTGCRWVMHISAERAATMAKKVKTAWTTALLPLRVGGIPERRDQVGLRRQPLEVVHEAVAAVLGVLVVHAHVDRLLGAHFLAVAAEDAPELVDLVDERVAVPLLVLARDQLDAVGGADLRAEAAGDALGAPLLVSQHPVGAAPTVGEGPGAALPLGRAPLFGVLHRHRRPEQVPEGQRHPLQRGPDVAHLALRPLHHLHTDRHLSPPPREVHGPAPA